MLKNGHSYCLRLTRQKVLQINSPIYGEVIVALSRNLLKINTVDFLYISLNLTNVPCYEAWTYC